MATTQELEPYPSITATYDDGYLFFGIAVLALPSFSPSFNTKSFSVTIRSSQNPPIHEAIILPPPPNDYNPFWHGSQEIKTASDQFPIMLEVKLWSHSDQQGLQDILIYEKDVAAYGRSGVVLKSQKEQWCDPDSESGTTMYDEDDEVDEGEVWFYKRHHEHTSDKELRGRRHTL